MRSKPHLNVGTIGHIDHGKTTLTAAILAVQATKGLAKVKSYGDIAKGGTVRDASKVVTITTSHAALDAFPEPVRAVERPFLMAIEGVHTIEGRGTVATGKIEQGEVRPGDKVEVVGLGGTLETVVTSVEAFRQALSKGVAGENVGLLLRGIKSTEIERGQVIAAPRSIKPHTRFKGEVYVLSKEEGGRHTPFFSGYSPQFFFRTTDVTGEANLADSVEMAMPGDNVSLVVELGKPVAIDTGSHFAIREGGKTVGSGVVVEVLA